MTSVRRVGVALSALVVVACAAPQESPRYLDRNDYGPRPADHERLFRGWLFSSLKDPMSAVVLHTAGPAEFQASGAAGNSLFGWGTCYTVNAKNSYGAYVGNRWYLAVVRNDAIVHVYSPGSTSRGRDYTPAETEAFCSSRPKMADAAPAAATRSAVFTKEVLSGISPGMSLAQVVALLGPPTSTTEMAFGQQLLQWLRTEGARGHHIALVFTAGAAPALHRVQHTFFQP
jgi:hypothetical protein